MRCKYDKNIRCEKEYEWKLYNQMIKSPIDKSPCKNCDIPEKIKRGKLESILFKSLI